LRYVTYCGPAKAIVRHDGTTFGLHPGHCIFEASDHIVRIGVLAVRDAVAMPVLVIVFRPAPVSAGTFKLAETATGFVQGLVQVPGVIGSYAESGTVTLNDGLRSGTFAFRVNGERVTGSWTCG
jgi:hypothetical protein